jgi:hypothetical protein
MKRAFLDGFGYVIAVGVVLCLYLGMAAANPWKPGKSKLPRLSSHGQGVAIENMNLPSPGIALGRPRR